MGLLPIQVGEYVSRLTRGAGIKGAVRPGLDDLASPVVQIADYTRAPFRQDECSHFGQTLVTASAGDGATIEIQNLTGLPVVLEYFHITNNGVATLIRYGFNAALFGGGTQQQAFRTYEKFQNVLFPVQGQLQPNLNLITNNTIVGISVPIQELSRFGLIVAGAVGADYERQNVDLEIPPGLVLAFCSTVVNASFWLDARIRVASNLVRP